MPPLLTAKKGTASLIKKFDVVVEYFNYGVCLDWAALGTAKRRPPSTVSFLPLKLFLWKAKEGSGVLLIKQHLKIVGEEGVLCQVPVRSCFLSYLLPN